MLLDLNKLHGPREHVERTLPPSALDPQDPEYRVSAPVALTMDVAKAGEAVFSVTGEVRTRLELTCSRCLEPFDVPVDAAFELRYVPQAENIGEGEREIAEDDLITAYYRGGMLDIGDLLREQFQLALPMKPLCNDACQGLCPECGANLNRTECGCSPVWEDSRLAPLKNLLTRQKEK
jgi:DUF177 domain-containing protein